MTESIVLRCRRQLLTALGTLVPEGPVWTAVDYPMHRNCGDGAIYAGQQAAARHLGVRVGRVLDRSSYRRSLVVPGSVVVLQGGGNWGGLYSTHHKLRLQVLSDLAGQPTVQMPQSIEYVDEEHRDELRRAVARHGNFTFLVRDQRTFDIAQRDYDCPVHLVPDLAFAMGELPRRAPEVPRVTQARTDKEAPEGQQRADTFDWLEAPLWSRTSVLLRSARKVSNQQHRVPSLTRVPALALTTLLARANVTRACSLLSRGEVAVTDRLHGHVLATLLRLPHVVVGDRFGKIKALHNTWLREDPVSRYVDSWRDVDAALGDLVSVGEQRRSPLAALS